MTTMASTTIPITDFAIKALRATLLQSARETTPRDTTMFSMLAWPSVVSTTQHRQPTSFPRRRHTPAQGAIMVLLLLRSADLNAQGAGTIPVEVANLPYELDEDPVRRAMMQFGQRQPLDSGEPYAWTLSRMKTRLALRHFRKGTDHVHP